MHANRHLPTVAAIMRDFADRTGLNDPHVAARRYLWTDAHAVCNFLSLHRLTGDDDYRRLAVALIDQVHAVLGRHRDDDARQGWISGLGDEEGRAHPTSGGLRIGKKLNERRRLEAIDERLEWERDGQYFHYLTKWMHALCRAGAILGDGRYRRWAVDLAKVSFAAFSVAAPGGKRLHWKMSIDLSYPLVASSGHHDPLDGYITFAEIRHSGVSGLDDELEELATMIGGREWGTVDPLGIGGLLFDAGRLLQLAAAGHAAGPVSVETLLRAADESLGAYMSEPSLNLPAEYRLAFRELGLSIGLHAIELMTSVAGDKPDAVDASTTQRLQSLQRYAPVAAVVEAFWTDAEHQRPQTWLEHADINEVMLATSLLPDEFLAL